MGDRDIAVLLAAEYHATNTPDPDNPDDEGPDDDGPDDDGPDDSGPDKDDPDDGGPDGGPDGKASDGEGRGHEGPGEGPGGEPDHRRHDDPDTARDRVEDDDPAPTPPAPTMPEPVVPGPRVPGEQGALDLPGLPDPSADADPDGETDGEADEEGAGVGVGSGAPPEVLGRGAGRLRHGTTEVRLRLTTALGLDEHPATVPGYGAVTAPIARTLLAARHHGEWRVVLTDPDGHLQHVLLARHRPASPTRPARPRDQARARGRAPGATRTGAIVELQVPTTLLAALNPDDHDRVDHVSWAPLLRELQQRLRELTAAGTLGRPPDADTPPELWSRRRAGAETERWVRARDRHCVAPWCGQPAHRAEIDHTRAHAYGGPSLSWNLGAWCSHDHRAKHLAGWTVRQPLPGWFVIRTRAGVTHTTRPPKILRPLPGPRLAREPRPLPYDGWRDTREELDYDWLEKIAPTLAARLAQKTQPTPPTPPAPTTPTPATPPDPDEPPPF